EPLPQAEKRELVSLFFDAALGEFVRTQTEGIVRAVVARGEHLQLELGDAGFRIPVTILDARGVDVGQLIDARVQVRGVVWRNYDESQPSTGRIEDYPPRLSVRSAEDLVLLEPAPPIATDVTPIRALITSPDWAAPGHRVRIRGEIVRVDSDRVLLVEDGGVVMPVETEHAGAFAAGQTIEAVGWPTRRRFTLTLQRSQVVPAPTESSARPSVSVALPTTINSISEIR